MSRKANKNYLKKKIINLTEFAVPHQGLLLNSPVMVFDPLGNNCILHRRILSVPHALIQGTNMQSPFADCGNHCTWRENMYNMFYLSLFISTSKQQ